MDATTAQRTVIRYARPDGAPLTDADFDTLHRIARAHRTPAPGGDLMDDTTTPRRVLTEEEYQEACRRAHTAGRLRGDGAAHVVAAVLAAAGVLTPPPRPDALDPDTCTALFPDDHGYWLQCQEDPGHPGHHNDGEFDWTDAHPDAVPPAGLRRR
ncbi:hypothetical protein I5Q34_07305 [Streptomyces sp. AV19]|uniref:hypothetical protein n=1 Tax=Streptomyces sp. AV19 TaxID=2793068 RepID=UPI0018FE7559|nr:hypothetical protein [Streptomyces sp. AV19]MBH1934102.1 hypothetical protein [Streptomyces sp. AV19]MDG4537176.1 hypothetical protein [Streptomyces sp. AV19]